MAWNWWEALRVGCITVGVAALQLLKFALLEANDQERRRGRLRGRQRDGEQDSEEKGVLSGMSPELRRALVEMIDYQITPVLVDQWRLGLVKVMLDPEEGPVIPDSDPQLRQGILDSIQSYQEGQDSKSAFRAGQTPPRYRVQEPDVPDEPSSSRPARGRAGPSRPRDPVVVTPPLPPSSEPSQAVQPTHVASSSRLSRLAQPIAVGQSDDSASAASRLPAASAPSLYPDIEPPSAPTLPDEGFEMVASPSRAQEPEHDECGICLDAKVEVQIKECRHQLCCECAKAICCLEGRAPQCPFCRGPMLGVSAIAM